MELGIAQKFINQTTSITRQACVLKDVASQEMKLMNHSKTESCGTRRTQWREDATRCIGRREVRAGPRETRAGPREARAGPL